MTRAERFHAEVEAPHWLDRRLRLSLLLLKLLAKRLR